MQSLLGYNMRADCLMGLALGVAMSSAMPLCEAHAQFEDRNTQQAVTLFRMSCMRFVGNPGPLRAWIASHNLLPVQGPAANYFAVVKPAQSFWASTADGKLVLSSSDNGACSVVAEHGRQLSFETELVGALQRDNVIVTPVRAQAKPDGTAMQQIYQASYGQKLWTLSVTTKVYPEAPNQLPLVILLATRPN